MTSALLCVLAFLATFVTARRSLGAGVVALMVVGFAYGILRANVNETYSYLVFDAAVVGLYAVWLLKPLAGAEETASQDLRIWLFLLIGWPLALFLMWRRQDFLVELVGLRANMFFLPVILLGARLAPRDLSRIAVALAGLDIAACALGVVQYSIGIRPFFPENDVTEIIYRSKDLVSHTAHRIPSSFANAHAFAGTLVMTLPFIGGAWLQRRRYSWESYLWPLAIAAVLLGVFMSATRTHTLTAVALVLVITFSGRLTSFRSLRWLVVVALIAWVVAGAERLQRFTTLADEGFLTMRLSSSLNGEALDLMGEYPMGNGLAGGGSSVPYFLEDRRSSLVGLENEYVRIAMEQGLPGLFIWIFFVIWVLSRGPGASDHAWARGRRLAWVAASICLVSGVTGIGMLTSIPQTTLVMLLIGWVGRSRPVEDVVAAGEEVPAVPVIGTEIDAPA